MTGASASSASVQIHWPAPTTAGGLLVAAVAFDDSEAVVSTSSGWTLVDEVRAQEDTKNVAVFMRYFAPVTTSATFYVSSGGLRVAAVEYDGVANHLYPVEQHYTVFYEGETANFVTGPFDSPLYSSNDLLLVAVACDDDALPFYSFSSGFYTASTSSDGDMVAAIVDAPTADTLIGPEPAWNATGSTSYKAIGVAFYPEDATPQYARGSVTLTGDALYSSSDPGFRARGRVSLLGSALVMEGFADKYWSGPMSVSGVAFVEPRYSEYEYAGSGVLGLSGAGEINHFNADGVWVVAGEALVTVDYSFVASGGFTILDDPYITEGGFELSGEAGVLANGVVVGTGPAVLSGIASVSANFIFLYGSAPGRTKISLSGRALFSPIYLEFEYPDTLGVVGRLRGQAVSEITYLNLSYEPSGGLFFWGDATEALSTINLSYVGGGSISVSGRAFATSVMVAEGGLHLDGYASCGLTTVNLAYSPSGNRRWRLSGTASTSSTAVHEASSAGPVVLSGQAVVYITGYDQASIGSIALDGEGLAFTGGVVHAVDGIILDGECDSAYYPALVISSVGGASLSGLVSAYPPSHQDGFGNVSLSAAVLVQRGWLFTFYSPQWWEKVGQFRLGGSFGLVVGCEVFATGGLTASGVAHSWGPATFDGGPLVSGLATCSQGMAYLSDGEIGTISGEHEEPALTWMAFGDGSLSVIGSWEVLAPIEMSGELTLAGEAVAFSGIGVAVGGEIGVLSGEHEAPVLGQSVLMVGELTIDGVAEVGGTAYHDYNSSFALTLSGVAYTIGLVNFGNQDGDGEVALTGLADFIGGYAVMTEGPAILDGVSVVAWGYSFDGDGSVGLSGFGGYANASIPLVGGGVSLDGRASVRAYFNYLVSTTGGPVIDGSSTEAASYVAAGARGGLGVTGLASYVAYVAYWTNAVGAVSLRGVMVASAVSHFLADGGGVVVFGGINDRQTADYVDATGGISMWTEAGESGPNMLPVSYRKPSEEQDGCAMTKERFLALLEPESSFYKDLVAAGGGWNIDKFICDERLVRINAGGRKLDVVLPTPVSTPYVGDDASASGRQRIVDPSVFLAPRRTSSTNQGRHLPQVRAALPVLNKRSVLASIPPGSPLRRELEAVGITGWEVVSRGKGRATIRVKGRSIDLAIPA